MKFIGEADVFKVEAVIESITDKQVIGKPGVIPFTLQCSSVSDVDIFLWTMTAEAIGAYLGASGILVAVAGYIAKRFIASISDMTFDLASIAS